MPITALIILLLSFPLMPISAPPTANDNPPQLCESVDWMPLEERRPISVRFLAYTGRYFIYDGRYIELPFTPHHYQPRADSQREPKLSPDQAWVSMGIALSEAHLNDSRQDTFSTADGSLVSRFDWADDWVHFVGWTLENNLVFLSTNGTAAALDVVNLVGESVETLPLPDLGFSLDTRPFDEHPVNLDFFFDSIWSPQSQGLVIWVRSASEQDVAGDNHIRLIDVPSQRVTFSLSGEHVDWTGSYRQRGVGNFSPTWSHDGESLTFFAPVEGETGHNFQLLLMSPDGEQRQIAGTEALEYVRHLRWSHDDRYLSFNGTIAGEEELYVFDVAENQLYRTGWSVEYGGAAEWSPSEPLLMFRQPPITAAQYPDERYMILDVERCLLNDAYYRFSSIQVWMR